MFKKVFLILIFSTFVAAQPPINLFRPSDRFLMSDLWFNNSFQFQFGYEGSVKVNGFRDDHDDCGNLKKHCHRKTNVLHIYEDDQNFLAALKNGSTKCADFAQLFNINDESGGQHLITPCGTFSVPMNALFSTWFNFSHGLSLGLHLPVITMELKDVRWLKKTDCSESDITDQLVKDFCTDCGLNIGSWKRTGIGDFVAQVRWLRDFPQYQYILKNVRTQLRFGLDFPTGLKADEDSILAIPFGNDGSWAVQIAGSIEVWLSHYFRTGVDVEFLTLFGNTRCRRVKTECNQTDFLFFTKVPAFREFGLQQQYNLYAEGLYKGFNFRLFYQFLKRNDDKLYISNDSIDPFIVNSAPSLFDWTIHSLIFNLGYDFRAVWPTSCYAPTISTWFKWGFNGKRAIVCDTVGFALSLNF